MKRTLLLIAIVMVLVAAAVQWDRAWLRSHSSKPAVKAANLAAAPNFTIKNLEGADVSLDQYRGKVVLVNFWATWCGPCRDDIPWLIEFHQKYGARGFTVLGLAMDDEGKSVVAPWVEKERFDVNGVPTAINYPILLADDATADKFGGVIGLPTSVLISRDGKIVKRFIGLVSYDTIAKDIEANL